ncbi:MAG: Veg protein [Firmicutes bacterium HGW-Firmicutes-12]|nr:MAG: Veg protein [Firmicutes bacterium HGW-Firmicutes-12]
MSARKVLNDIKRDLEPFVGDKIRLRANRGRKKVIEKTGVLESTYPNIFVIRLDEKQIERRISFSYADILTDSVQLTVSRGDEDIMIKARSC